MEWTDMTVIEVAGRQWKTMLQARQDRWPPLIDKEIKEKYSLKWITKYTIHFPAFFLRSTHLSPKTCNIGSKGLWWFYWWQREGFMRVNKLTQFIVESSCWLALEAVYYAYLARWVSFDLRQILSKTFHWKSRISFGICVHTLMYTTHTRAFGYIESSIFANGERKWP